MRPARRVRRRLLPLLLATLFACDVAGTTGSEGCLRVHQGGGTFPAKRVVEGAVATRVTAAGTALITSHLQALLGSLFELDDEGQALVPLEALGLQTVTTTIGPFTAELTDAVLTLDLASLNVTLVEDSAPPRFRISVVDADVGIHSGVVAGAVDLALVEPDLACPIGNGPNDRVARLSFTLDVTLATDADGRLQATAEARAAQTQRESDHGERPHAERSC